VQSTAVYAWNDGMLANLNAKYLAMERPHSTAAQLLLCVLLVMNDVDDKEVQ